MWDSWRDFIQHIQNCDTSFKYINYFNTLYMHQHRYLLVDNFVCHLEFLVAQTLPLHLHISKAIVTCQNTLILTLLLSPLILFPDVPEQESWCYSEVHELSHKWPLSEPFCFFFFFLFFSALFTAVGTISICVYCNDKDFLHIFQRKKKKFIYGRVCVYT